ncbi:MAG TPA: tRNA (adenosine(37)-N6)-threonylcarbamoyltransferase complex dimerization subunit type 1 TsaB [Thermoanaerobaculia bacterium]|jgi:tRNA threonylcarbamoyl adenosine modification protein YeaZ|nr:tRNA (adenosine(37)-N6)-threonylcarbamoyltransferase complex dimerization subunit type 1 TsaB [Thermoanaerobaculia bacterium]
MSAPSPLLLLDTGSPLVSVAVAREGKVLAQRSVEQHRSSALLLELVQEALAEAGIGVQDLGGIAALRGPGSFTGLRIGLATALGLHQALGVPATALPTLQVLAAAADVKGTVIAAVDALRGEWSAQAFLAGRALSKMELVPGPELPRLAGGRPAAIVGFGVSRLSELADRPGGPRLVEPGPLAPLAARLAASPETEWSPALLVSPIYSRPPAISLPRPRAAVPAPREA